MKEQKQYRSMFRHASVSFLCCMLLFSFALLANAAETDINTAGAVGLLTASYAGETPTSTGFSWKYDSATGKITGTVNPAETPGTGCDGQPDGSTDYGVQSSTLTLTNTSYDKVSIMLRYGKASGSGCSMTVNDSTSVVNATTTQILQLDRNQSIKFKLTSGNKSGYTAKATIEILHMEDASSAMSVTFKNTVDNLPYTVAGQSISNEAKTVTTLKAGDTVTLNPGTGCAFYKAEWTSIDGSKTLSLALSENSFQIPGAGTVQPYIVNDENGIAPFLANSQYFYDWDSAFAAAGSNGTVVLNDNYDLPARKDPYVIPEGYTFVIPCDSKNTAMTTSPTTVDCGSSGSYVQPSIYRTMTIKEGANIEANGNFCVSAQVAMPGAGYHYPNGGPYGPVPHVVMENNSSITVNSGLYCYGYISGAGTITVSSGAKVYECLQIMDYRGGDATNNMNNNHGTYGVFPFSQYYVQNIEVETTYSAGATLTGYTAIKMSIGSVKTTIKLIGNTSEYLFYNTGTLVKKYDPVTDRIKYTISGNATLNAIKITLPISGFGSRTIDSTNYMLPFSSNMTVNVASGILTFNQKTAMIPGSQLIVGNDASIVLSKDMHVYDLDDWGPYVYQNSSAPTAQMRQVPWQASKLGAPSARTLTDASIIVNGELVATTGKLYTTPGGASITSTGTGKITMVSPSDSTAYQVKQAGSDPSYLPITITSAKLKNEADTAAGGTVYLETKGTSATASTEYNFDHYICCGDTTEVPSTSKHGNWVIGAHTPSSEVTSPATCTVAGSRTNTCSCAIHSYAEEIPPLGHSDANNIDLLCDIAGCGKPLAKLYMNANADAETELVLKFEVHESLYENITAEISFPGRTDYTSGWSEVDGQYFLTVMQPVASGEMTEKLKVTLSSTEVNFAILGTADLSVERSIVDYARAVLKMPYPDDTTSQEYATVKAQKKLVAALVNYGGYAQTFFALKNNETPPAKKDRAYALLTEDIIIHDEDRPDMTSNALNSIENNIQGFVDKNIIKVTQEPILNSAISQTVFFELASDYSFASDKLTLTYKKTFKGEEQEFTLTMAPNVGNDGITRYVVTIENIPAAFLDYDYQIKGTYVYNGNGTEFKVYPSITSYLSRVIANNGNIYEDGEAENVWEARLNLAKAMYLYNQAAKELFEKTDPKATAEMEVTE